MNKLVLAIAVIGFAVFCLLSIGGIKDLASRTEGTAQFNVMEKTTTAMSGILAKTSTAQVQATAAYRATGTAQIIGTTATAAYQATEVQRIADRNSANATAQAAQATAQYLNSQATATQQAIYYQQTAVVEDLNRQATTQAIRATETSASQRKTETAYNAQQTAQAQATSTERAWIITQTAQAGYTTLTAQVLQTTATRQADLAAVQRTAEAVQAESMSLALERERMTNTINAIVPWLIGIALAFVLLFILWRWSKVRQVGTVLVLDGRTVYDPDRNPLPWMTITDGGQVDAPLLAPVNLQAETTRRDQAIEALKVLPNGQARPPRGVFAPPVEQPTSLPGVVKIEIVEPEKVMTWLTEVEDKYLPDAEEK